jgi:hypothetical protein
MWYVEPYGWSAFLTILGIVVIFGGTFVVNKMFPTPAKAMKQPVVKYVPDHIDQQGTVVMRKE